MISSAQLRESFLRFFESKGHRRIKSASLVPQNDPTLFFTNAGMVPFKNVFTGQENIGTSRATTSQKCMRVSGKHNDLENVGRTLRHHTFFEMLGNFSFGDYFKKDAIRFAWEFLTEVIGLDKSRLWITVFREDLEAEELWKQETDVSHERILRFDEKDNFWSMGETGPCGPCTEIHYDHGESFGCGRSTCAMGCDCDRFMEIWNLVFMQFNRTAGGELQNLPKPSVDTGMGLERLACVVQGVHGNYDTDLFMPLLHSIAALAGKKYGDDDEADVSMRVIADHIRATTFLIADGVLPSNEGRGYVLRRIMRRAIRHGRLLGLKEAFFFKLAQQVAEAMGAVYQELPQNQKFIEEVIRAEEARFLETLEKGLEIIGAEIQSTLAQGGKTLSGEVAFRLYDTYGFPLDLSETIAAERELNVDMVGFEALMEAQRQKARSAWKGSGAEKTAVVHQQLLTQGIETEFLGYQTLECLSKVSALVREGKRVESLREGESGELYTEYSPFYGESGGQVGDLGEVLWPQGLAQVTDTQVPLAGLISHWVRVELGELRVGSEVHLRVHRHSREPTKLNHTATHLLHAALRQVLGEHVKQAGSLVASHRLRFDFSHFQPLSLEQLQKIEDLVNEKIREDLEVQKRQMTYDAAISEGAMALFGEKYGDEVRVLKIGDFSTELCGGTHVDRTGEIGLFKILSDASVAAGVRRIEAITGADTLLYLRRLETQIQSLATKLKVTPDEILERVDRQSDQLKKQEQEIRRLKAQLASGGHGSSDDWSQEVREVQGIKILALRRDVEDIESLRELSDQLMQKLGSGLMVLGSAHGGKATLIVRVSKDLTEKFHAGDLIRELAPLLGGKGGGRPDMAQAGGSNVDGLAAALEKVFELLA